MDDETESLKARIRTVIPMLYGKEAHKIQLIKMVRVLIPGIGLKEAKDFTEWAIEGDRARLACVENGELVHNPEKRTVHYVEPRFGTDVRVCWLAYEEDCDYPHVCWDFSGVTSAVASEAVRICKDRWGF